MSIHEEQSNQARWKVLNPEAEYEVSVQTMAPRLEGLNNKKIGLFWNGKPSGDILLEAIGKILTQRFENVTLIKFNLHINVGVEKIKEMAAQCDGVIAAVGD